MCESGRKEAHVFVKEIFSEKFFWQALLTFFGHPNKYLVFDLPKTDRQIKHKISSDN